MLLLAAALLETGGDAVVRVGLRTTPLLARGLVFLTGAAALFAYGYVVNAPPWDFGRLLGVYVVIFFLVAQLLAWLVFGHKPTPSIWIGGAFIACGGIIVALGSLR